MNEGGVVKTNPDTQITNCTCRKTKNEIKVEKTSTSYVLIKQSNTNYRKVKIHAHIFGDKLTIMPDNEHTKFEFRKSETEMIQDIAELLLAAVKLINNNKHKG